MKSFRIYLHKYKNLINVTLERTVHDIKTLKKTFDRQLLAPR